MRFGLYRLRRTVRRGGLQRRRQAIVHSRCHAASTPHCPRAVASWHGCLLVKVRDLERGTAGSQTGMRLRGREAAAHETRATKGRLSRGSNSVIQACVKWCVLMNGSCAFSSHPALAPTHLKPLLLSGMRLPNPMQQIRLLMVDRWPRPCPRRLLWKGFWSSARCY